MKNNVYAKYYEQHGANNFRHCLWPSEVAEALRDSYKSGNLSLVGFHKLNLILAKAHPVKPSMEQEDAINSFMNGQFHELTFDEVDRYVTIFFGMANIPCSVMKEGFKPYSVGHTSLINDYIEAIYIAKGLDITK